MLYRVTISIRMKKTCRQDLFPNRSPALAQVRKSNNEHNRIFTYGTLSL